MESRPFHRPGAGAALWILCFAALCLSAAGDARGETWLCPICQVERIEVPDWTGELDCPACGISLSREDLRIPIAYLISRTRPTRVLWDVTPECGLFRKEGLLAAPAEGDLWVPWSAVEYYIPRMRILRLTSGAEIPVPYAQGPTCERDEQPLILATVADSVGDWRRPGRIESHPIEESLSALFVIARSPAARDAARDRFIEEIEAGNHPRLPRTQPRAYRTAEPTAPGGVSGEPVEVVLEIRASERGRVLKVRRLRGSGRPEFDSAALLAAYRSAVSPAGELGVGVPSSMTFRYLFGDTVRVETEPVDPPVWHEWVEPPED